MQTWNFSIRKEYREEDYPNEDDAREQFIEDIAQNNFEIEDDGLQEEV